MMFMITPEAITSELSDRESLLKEIIVRDEKIIKLDQENHHLKEQLAWFKRQIFGKRSERVVSDLNPQQLVFEGFENLATKKREKSRFLLINVKNLIVTARTKLPFLKIYLLRTTILDIPEDEKDLPRNRTGSCSNRS